MYEYEKAKKDLANFIKSLKDGSIKIEGLVDIYYSIKISPSQKRQLALACGYKSQPYSYRNAKIIKENQEFNLFLKNNSANCKISETASNIIISIYATE